MELYMSEDETLFIAFLFSVTGIAAKLFGFDIPQWVFTSSVIALTVTITFTGFRIWVGNAAGRASNDQKPKEKAGNVRSSISDQRIADRKAMEDLLKR
jgi:hypothetical protein|tara:strand:- start:281 stop:574 length:294 start_codon:yes stop_codon:yes gene_type:complete